MNPRDWSGHIPDAPTPPPADPDPDFSPPIGGRP